MYFIPSTNFHRQDQDYSLSSILHRLFIFTDREHSAKNRQKVKTEVEVSGVSERELKIDIMYALSNHNNFRRVVRSSWILTVGLRPSYKNIALFVLCFLVIFLRLLESIFSNRGKTQLYVQYGKPQITILSVSQTKELVNDTGNSRYSARLTLVSFLISPGRCQLLLA